MQEGEITLFSACSHRPKVLKREWNFQFRSTLVLNAGSGIHFHWIDMLKQAELILMTKSSSVLYTHSCPSLGT